MTVGNRRVYIAGPMRGVDQLNWPAFDSARDFLISLGLDPVSPADIDREAGITPDGPFDELVVRDCMRRDLHELMECDVILMLPGWENSRGAIAEHAVATAMSIPVLVMSGKSNGCCRSKTQDS